VPVFDLVAEALGVAAPDLFGELLLADSSRAHFRQVLVRPVDAHEIGCGVVSPEDCPPPPVGNRWSFPLVPHSMRAPTYEVEDVLHCVFR
jgi:hypothetical protein